MLRCFERWTAFAREPSTEPEWIASLESEAIRQAVAMPAAPYKQTVEAYYGRPVPLLTVLDGYERFGNGGLPEDPLRPGDPRRDMRDPVTWFCRARSRKRACVWRFPKNSGCSPRALRRSRVPGDAGRAACGPPVPL